MKKKSLRLILIIFMTAILFLLSGCGKEEKIDDNSNTSKNDSNIANQESSEVDEADEVINKIVEYVNEGEYEKIKQYVDFDAFRAWGSASGFMRFIYGDRPVPYDYLNNFVKDSLSGKSLEEVKENNKEFISEMEELIKNNPDIEWVSTEAKGEIEWFYDLIKKDYKNSTDENLWEYLLEYLENVEEIEIDEISEPENKRSNINLELIDDIYLVNVSGSMKEKNSSNTQKGEQEIVLLKKDGKYKLVYIDIPGF